MVQPDLAVPDESPGISGRSHSFSLDHRRRPETLRTAMATAFFWPTISTEPDVPEKQELVDLQIANGSEQHTPPAVFQIYDPDALLAAEILPQQVREYP